MDVWDQSPPLPPEGEPLGDGAAAAAGGGSGLGGGEPPAPPDSDGGPWWSQRIVNVPAWLLLFSAIVIWVGIIAALLLPGDSDHNPAALAGVIAATIAPQATESADTTVLAATSVLAPATDPLPTTVPATTAVSVTTTTTAADTTTTTATTVTVEPAPAAISDPTTTTRADGATLTVTPRQGECHYGPDCFVASFSIAGFATQPQEFVCEFSSGARYVFRFSSTGADPACSTLDVPDSIVVEVDGLRTDPSTITPGS